MEPETTGASTEDWLEATKNMTIVAYIGLDILGQGGDDQPLTKERFEDTLRKASRPTGQRPESPLGEGRSET